MSKSLELYLQKLAQRSTLQAAYQQARRSTFTPSRLAADQRALTPSAPVLTIEALGRVYTDAAQGYPTGMLVGTPGSGVSTTLNALAYAAAQQAATHANTPLPLVATLDEKHQTLDAVIEQAFWEAGLPLQGNVLQELIQRAARPLWLLLDIAPTFAASTAATALDALIAALDATYPTAHWLVGGRDDVVWHLPSEWQRYDYYRQNLPPQKDAVEEFMQSLDPVVRAGMEQLLRQVPALRELLRRPIVAQKLSEIVRDIPDGTARTIIVSLLRSMMGAAHAKSRPDAAFSDENETLLALLNAGKSGLRLSAKNAQSLPALRRAGVVEQLSGDRASYRLADDAWLNVVAVLAEPSTTNPATPPIPMWNLTLATATAANLDELEDLERQITLAQSELHYRKAVTLRDEGRGREAMAQIRAALSITPERADFQVVQGTIAIQNEQYDEGRIILEEALPYAPSGDGYYQLATAYHSLGWQSEACQAFSRAADFNWHGQATAAARAAPMAETPEAQRRLWQRAIDLNDSNPQWHVAIGQLYAAEGDESHAATHYQAALRLSPTHGEANYALGMMAFQQGNLSAARQHLLVATATPPNPADPNAPLTYSRWFVALGAIFEAANDPKGAEASYNQAISHAPRNPNAYAKKGVLLRRTRRFEDALYLLQESLMLDNEQSEVHFELGLLHEAQGHFAEAVQAYRHAARLDPNTTVIHTHLGKAHREMGDPHEAQQWLERALDLDPAHSPALTEMGLLAEAQGDFAHAARFYADAIAAMPQNVQAIFRQGVMQLHLERPSEALPLLEVAAKTMPTQAEVQWYHGEALQRTGAGEAALSAYRKAIRLVPENLAYRYAFARHALTLKRWEDARLALDIILEQEPQSVAALVMVAELNSKKGAFTAALDAYRAAIAIEPQNSDLYLQSAQIHAQIGELEAAIFTLQQAVTLIGDSADLLSQIAALYEEQGMMESACEQLNLALEHDPSHRTARLQRARLHTKLAHRKAAYHDWQSLLKYHPDCHEAHFGIGWLQEQDGLYSEALAAYQRALVAESPAPAWLVAYGRVALKKGQKEAAQSVLKRVVQHGTGSASPQLYAEAHYLLAQTVEGTAALNHLEKALDLDKRNPTYFLAFAQRQDAVGKRQAAFAALENARTFAGADGDILAQIAQQYDEWGYNHEAIQSYSRAVEFVPTSAPLWVRLATLQRGMDKTTEARESLEEALRHHADYAPAHRELGRTAEQLGDFATAEKHYTIALRHDPDDLVALERLAMRHLSAKAYDAAEKLLKHALTLPHSGTSLYTLLGTLYVQSERPAHALDIWQRAAEQEPNAPMYHRERGRAHLQMGQLEEAKQALLLARRMPPSDADVHFLLGQVWEALEDLTQATAAYQQAIYDDTSDGRYHRALAEIAMRQQKWDEALLLLREAKDVEANDPETDYLMALCYEQMGGETRLNQAIERAQRAATLAPDTLRYRRQLGDLYAKQGQWSEAYACYQALAPLQPQERTLAMALGRSAVALGYDDRAIVAFRDAVALQAFDPEANRLLAESIMHLYQPVLLASLAQAEFPLPGEFNAVVMEGLEAAQRAYDYGGGDLPSTKVLAQLYLLKQEPATAFALLQRTDPTHFGRGLFGELDGMVLLAVGDTAQAAEALRHAARTDNSNPRLWLAYSVASDELGNPTEALHFAKDAVQFAPDEGIYKYAYAHLCLRNGKPKRARDLLAQAIAQRPTIPAWHRHLAMLALEAGDFAAAHTALTTALALMERHTPDDHGEEGLILRSRAHVFRTEGKITEAITELRRAIACFAANATWYQELALLLQNMGDYDGAEVQYRAAMKVQPDNPDIALALAHLLEVAHKPQSTLETLEAAAQTWATNVPVWCQLGRVRLDGNQPDAAQQAFQTALTLDPVEPLALLGMAQYHAHRQQWEEERAMIQKAYEVAPTHADVLTQLGRLYMQSSQDKEARDEAARYFHAALQQERDHLYAHYYIATLYAADGHFDAALEHFSAAVQRSPRSAWVWAALADCYAQQGNYSAGVDCYQEALHCDPHNGQFHFYLGSLHFKHHRFNDAIAAYRKAEKLDYRRDKCRLYILEARAKLVMGVK